MKISGPGVHVFAVVHKTEEEIAGSSFHFGIKADKQDDGANAWDVIWETVSDVGVPIEKWCTLELGGDTSGRSVVHVTKADGVRYEVADQTGWTHSPDGVPDGFKDINTMKLYTSDNLMCELKAMDKALENWWDDYAVGGR